MCVYVHVVVCVGGEMWAQTPLTETPEVYLEPYLSPEDNLTCCPDLQGSGDEIQVCEGQVTWLEWSRLPF